MLNFVLRRQKQYNCGGAGLFGRRVPPYRYEQTATLVNVKIKWAKDRFLDSAVSRERHLIPAHFLVHTIRSSPDSCIPVRSPVLRRLCRLLPFTKPATFLRRHPSLFHECRPTRGPNSASFSLTPTALSLLRDERDAVRQSERDLVDRLRKLLMLSPDNALPLHTIDLLSWDLGLPANYARTLITKYSSFFRLDAPSDTDERVWLRLLCRDESLAVPHLRRTSEDSSSDPSVLPFPISFPRGFGLKKKCMSWLSEWQSLPYTSPYADASGLDHRTDGHEKRVVGVFHELLHLTLAKKTQRSHLSNLRAPLRLPQKFSKVFGRHPGIFYLSRKMATETVVLREAYGGGRRLLEEYQHHPILEVRERYMDLLRSGLEDLGETDSDLEESNGTDLGSSDHELLAEENPEKSCGQA